MNALSLVFWICAGVAGIFMAVSASRKALSHAIRLAEGLAVSRLLVGTTLLAVGTDLPEIANSFVACLSSHGDINLGDSVGSAMTQSTLVLGLLPFLGPSIRIQDRRVAVIGSATIAGLALGALLYSDGYLSRFDGFLLMVAWLVAMVTVYRLGTAPPAPRIDTAKHGLGAHAALALFYLALVGIGATVAVTALVRLSSAIGVPEYLLTFFAASVGTSLPELVVDAGALGRGESQLAIGGVFGSSLLDATVSIAAGVLVAPVSISADLALRGAMASIVAIALVTLILSLYRRHTRKSGLVFILVYVAMFPILIAGQL